MWVGLGLGLKFNPNPTEVYFVSVSTPLFTKIGGHMEKLYVNQET